MFLAVYEAIYAGRDGDLSVAADSERRKTAADARGAARRGARTVRRDVEIQLVISASLSLYE